MNQLIFSDEIKSLSSKLNKLLLSKNLGASFESIYIIADNNPVAEYIAAGFSANLEDKTFFVNAFQNATVNKDFCETNGINIKFVDVDTLCSLDSVKNTVFILLLDSNSCDEKWFEVLDICSQKAKQSSTNKIAIGTILPCLRDIPDGINCFAEREYNYFVETLVTDKTDAENFYIKLEKKCRQIAKTEFKSINIFRFDNLFGPNGAKTPNVDFEAIINDAFTSGKVEITEADYCTSFSCVATADAAYALTKALYTARIGHIYNLSLYNVTLADLKNSIFKGYSDRITLSANVKPYEESDKHYYQLSHLKAQSAGLFPKKLVQTFKDMMYRTVTSISGNEYDVQKQLTFYQGKLQRLKDIEIDILAEIDRICKKHDIKWFLAGGSLLGAVRENKSIAWDDDLDIGFLREDFEKFKKVAPLELDKKYYYSSPWTDDDCHYYIDKIRLKSSYFSTAYSSHFTLEDGVFVDLIVYDQTSSNRLLEKFQIKFICMMVAALRIRWYNQPKKPRYKFWKRVLPILRLIPWKTLHKLFDFSATMFSKNKKAEYLLDSTGQHIRNGRFPKYYLEELTEAEFDGMMCPIPVHYDEYLSFFYGPNYFPKPSISSQVGAHKIARMDLGEFIFEDKQPGDFREVNIDGELFEDELN